MHDGKRGKRKGRRGGNGGGEKWRRTKQKQDRMCRQDKVKAYNNMKECTS